MYQPLDGLTNVERGLVERALSSPRRSRTSRLGLLAPEECFEVYETTVADETLYCPTHTRLRWLLGLIAFVQSMPDAVPLFFTPEEVSKARQELELVQKEYPGIRAPIVQSLWHVPPQWFVCFDDSDRRIEQAGEHPTIRYETTMTAARERVDRALDTITGGIVHPVIVGVIYELKEWLKDFCEAALLELDYASVASLFEPDDLADDHSASDVWSAIGAFGDGDGMKAGLYYRRVSARWSQMSSRVGSLN